MPIREGKAGRGRVGLLFASFFVTGMVTVILGPLIPELRERWGVSAAEVALLFPIQFIVSSVASAFSSLRLRLSLILGFSSMAGGLLTLAAGGWPLAPVAFALVGAGLGFTIPATNLIVAHLAPERRGSALALLNLTWGLGATACPLLFALLRQRGSTDLAPWLIAAAAAAFALLFAVRPGERRPATERTHRLPAPGGGWRAAVALLPLAGLLLLYVGTENAIAGWLIDMADRLGGERGATSMLIGSGFWGAVLTGRGLTPLFLRRLSEPAVYAGSLALAGAGALTLLVAGSQASLAAGAVVAGLGCAPLFPLTISLIAGATAADGSRGAGWVFAGGGLGGAALPWLTGRLAAAGGEVGALPYNPGFLVPVLGVAAMALLFGLRGRFGTSG